MKFYNRTEELSILHRAYEQSKKSACFTVLIGRRRIGKTTLVMESVSGKRHLYLFVARKNEQLMCAQFQEEAKRALGIEIFGSVADFRTLFELLLKFSMNEHYTLIIDEFQELERINKSIIGDIQDVWDRYSADAKIHLIVCGSVYSMMRRLFENEKEPLFGRLTSKMVLKPFDIKTLKEVLKDHNPRFTHDDLLCLYLISGGIPKYIHLLIASGSVTKDAMIDFIVRQDSPFLGEGRDLLISEFGKEYGTYFSILQLIASGRTTQAEIDSIIEKNTGAYLANLESVYSLIRKNKPVFSKPGSRNTRWSLNDNFLMFWFRFIFPNQSMIELGKHEILKQYVLQGYDQYSGLVLEKYFTEKISQEEDITDIGRYWDKTGENEIDIVATNSIKKRAVIAEVKRNKRRIDLDVLKRKAISLQHSLSAYNIEYRALSLDDM